ncbi:hypothetical protein SAMN02745866_04260 [Alteromonadaceae bacterium Bs31]|nr:hypothetical protein SAMN02745866_04260 [Alteromonadaceae bacterium Bs31]
MPTTIQEKLSWVPLKIDLMFDDEVLGVGTAFAYLFDGETYLITNWHNVSGRHPETLKVIHTQAAIPNRFNIHYPIEVGTAEPPLETYSVCWGEHILDLYEEEVPQWYEHPKYGHAVDAVAIPFGIEESRVIAANSENLGLVDISLRPSLDAYVLGFPRGLSGGAKFPVWKRASIASEPEIDLNQLPKFYVDTATREGMSGSPVYAQSNGFSVPQGKGLKDSILGTSRKFAGIYSGRVGDDPFFAQLGIVWKEKAIIEIIKGKIVGTA